jgi:alpha-tubulin suppressor-like RCC1 family protein
LSDVVAIDGGYGHNLALKNNGTIVAWGAGQTIETFGGISGLNYGQSIIPAGLSNVMAVAAGQVHSLVLRSNGTVLVWGDGSAGLTNMPVGLTNVTAIAAGHNHSLALLINGTVVAWGMNYPPEMTNVPAGLGSVVAIDAGDSHSLALRSNGTVVAWGSSLYGQTNVPAGLSDVTAIAAGAFHNLALKNNGTVVAWGAGLTNEILGGSFGLNYGQSIIPAGLSNVVAIAAGGFHSLALQSNGTLVAWGAGLIKELEGGPSGVNFGQAIIPGGLNSSNVTAVSTLCFSFTNQPGASFSVLASADVAAPMNTWINLGAPVESPAGTFTFTNVSTTTFPGLYYRVSSP